MADHQKGDAVTITVKRIKEEQLNTEKYNGPKFGIQDTNGNWWTAFDHAWGMIHEGEVVQTQCTRVREYNGKTYYTVGKPSSSKPATQGAPAVQKEAVRQDARQDGQRWGCALHCASRVVAATIASGNESGIDDLIMYANVLYAAEPGTNNKPPELDDSIPF